MSQSYFSKTYAEARERFLNASRREGARLRSYCHPLRRGPAGEELAVDVASCGTAPEARVMVVVSGTHGVEGFAGSAAQLAVLGEGWHRRLGEGTALVLVHALNPYGFAHLRRVDENNVDVNRNFIDHDHPPGTATAYSEVHSLLVPEEWSGPARHQADARLAALVRERGTVALQSAVTGGQWSHPDGLFYGGQRPAWSNDVWRDIVRTELAPFRSVAVVDIHTGLGEAGATEVIFRGRSSGDGYQRARRWYGDRVTMSEDGTSVSTVISGNAPQAVLEELGEAQVTAVTLEFGTVSKWDVLNALRGDNWLHVHGQTDHHLAPAIRDSMRAAFTCDTSAWTQHVIEDSCRMVGSGLAGLAAETV